MAVLLVPAVISYEPLDPRSIVGVIGAVVAVGAAEVFVA